MNRTTMMLIGVVLCFVAAGINIYTGNSTWIAGLLIFSAVMLIISIFRERGR